MKILEIRSRKYGLFLVKVDDEDFELVRQFRWFYAKPKNHAYFYSDVAGPGCTRIYLHRLILSCPPGMVIDHIDGDTFNNQRSNLRICTRQQNAWNSKRKASAKSPYKGVYKNRNSGWIARISITLGIFDTPEEAARAYDEAAKVQYGEFARINHG